MNICKIAHISKCKEKRPFETKMKEKYIFISYAHKDSDTVVPIIKALSEKYNIWYDDGIEAGSEWPEYIADKLSESDTVIAFVTKNALKSHNCKREINFALDENKDMIIVYLEEVELTRGMKMQLGMLQAVYYNRYSTIEQFIDKLSSSEFITDCLKNTKKTINPVELEEDEDEQEDDYIFSTEPTQGLVFSFI